MQNLEAVVLEQIDEVKEKYHGVDKDIAGIRSEMREIRHAVKNIAAKLEFLTELDSRVKVLESIQEKKKWTIENLYKVLNFIKHFWAVFLIVALIFFAFDITIEVENPHVLDYLKSKIL